MSRHARFALVALVFTMVIPVPTRAEYLDADALAASLRRLANGSRAASIGSFGESRSGRPLWVLTLALPTDTPPEDRTALLLTAGIDGDHLVGTDVAVKVAEKLLDALADGDESVGRLLTDHTVYVIPRVNPDAHQRCFVSPGAATPNTTRPVDDDRDGALDEDGPNDLNGDGFITMMRVKDPQSTHVANKDHPRLVRMADRAKDERPVYKVYTEGLDDDGDGEYNEDAPGGVDLNANFLHGYQEHAPNVGPYQLCEPESRALVDFVLEHPRIAIAITYGRHNNMLEVDTSGKKNSTDKAPVELHEDDASIYKHIGERFKELTGIEKAPKRENNGAFYAWAYAQYGVPSFATSLWHRPEPEKKEGEEGRDGESKMDEADANPSDNEPAATPDRPRRGRGRRGGRGPGRGRGEDEKKKEPPEDIGEEAAWLKYSDEQRGGDGFVEWTPFEHPALGHVEIGGFKPLFKINPPHDAVDALADAQLKFLLDAAGRFPDIKLDQVEVIERNANVFEINAHLRNDGYFPSGLEMAKENRRVRPIVVALDIDHGAVLGGERVHRVWRVEGGGGTYELRWLIRGRRNSTVPIRVTSEKYGDFAVDVFLQATEPKKTGAAQ